MSNAPLRLLSRDRRVVLVKPYLLGSDAYRGYARAPWDCLCAERTVCRCDQRPTRPPATREAIEQAKAYIVKLGAGIEAASRELAAAGGEVPPWPGTERERDREAGAPPPAGITDADILKAKATLDAAPHGTGLAETPEGQALLADALRGVEPPLERTGPGEVSLPLSSELPADPVLEADDDEPAVGDEIRAPKPKQRRKSER